MDRRLSPPRVVAACISGSGPLLAVLPGRKPRTAFKAGYAAGLAHHITMLYWIYIVLVQYGHLSWFLALPTFFLLVGVLALFPACFTWSLVMACKYLSPRPGGWGWILFGSILFTGLEFLQSFFLTGFPWNLWARAWLFHKAGSIR